MESSTESDTGQRRTRLSSGQTFMGIQEGQIQGFTQECGTGVQPVCVSQFVLGSQTLVDDKGVVCPKPGKSPWERGYSESQSIKTSLNHRFRKGFVLIGFPANLIRGFLGMKHELDYKNAISAIK